jgi:hypothetical protein
MGFAGFLGTVRNSSSFLQNYNGPSDQAGEGGTESCCLESSPSKSLDLIKHIKAKWFMIERIL